MFWLGVLAGLGISWLYQVNQLIDGDQTQMIHKGYLAAHHGIWTSFGNAASVVGNVPGFLSAVVVGGPLLLWDSPYAIITVLTLLRLAGFLMLDSVIRQALPGSPLTRLVFLLLIWLNPWVQYDSLLYNPAYLIFCAGLHLYTAWHLRRHAGFFMTVLHVASIGLAMQLHFSWPLLAILSVLLWWRRMIQVNWVGVLVAVSLIVWSLLPYLQQLWADPSLASNPDPKVQERYIGWGAVHVYPVLKSVIYWLRYGAWAFPSKLVNDAGFDWLAFWPWIEMVMVFVWRLVVHGLAAVTLVICLVANVRAFGRVRVAWRRSHGPVISTDLWLLLYATAAFVAVMVSAGLSPLVFNYWHLVLILPAATLPVLVWVVKDVYRGSESNLKPLVVCASILLIVNLVGMTDSRKFSWKADYAGQVTQYVQESVKPIKPAQAP